MKQDLNRGKNGCQNDLSKCQNVKMTFLRRQILESGIQHFALFWRAKHASKALHRKHLSLLPVACTTTTVFFCITEHMDHQVHLTYFVQQTTNGFPSTRLLDMALLTIPVSQVSGLLNILA